MKNPRLILASTSPRRIELLRLAGLDPEVIAPNTDEIEIPGESPAKMVMRLAQEKAEASAFKAMTHTAPKILHKQGLLIIAADTTVVAPGTKKEVPQTLGKPINKADAARMLRLLSGKAHTVLTGYCILKLTPSGKKPGLLESHVMGRVVQSTVKIRKLTAREITHYIATGEPMDKAGSYAAQGLGMALIEEIQGSYTNVVGLPVCQVLQDLESRFKWKWLENTSKKRAKK